jgi:signal peptidase II
MTEPSSSTHVSEPAPSAAPSPLTQQPAATTAEALGKPPTFVFFGIIAAISLILDVASKAWAEITLSKRSFLDPSIVLVKDHLQFTLAYNKGGAWGLLQNASEEVRKPFFLLVSILAIAFIVSLYGRLMPGQRALKWGLPLVLGGALGNLSDRITRSSVIDFIDYRADWIESMNTFIARYVSRWSVTDHWPTFNVADIAICIGVGLMAVDMFTSRRQAPSQHSDAASPPPLAAGDPAASTKPPAG